MKIFVIGGSGLVGSHIIRLGRAAGHEVIGTYRSNPLPSLMELDGADERAFTELLNARKPEFVVHTAGWMWVDGCESDPARAIAENAAQPAWLAKLCYERGIHFTYVSTSYVFDGKNGPYSENATANPINAYARSKWEGEQRVTTATKGQALLPRLICVYGAEAQKKNFAWQVLKAMQEGKPMLLPSDQEGNPTYAGDIARWLLMLLEKREHGPWHLGGPWPECKRPEWAEKLVAAFNALGIQAKEGFTIKSVPTAELKQPALRPLKAGMISTIATNRGFTPTDFNESIREMLALK